MLKTEQENIATKADELKEKITASVATQEEKDEMVLIINQIITDLTEIEAEPNNC